jgi:hypothetical protein
MSRLRQRFHHQRALDVLEIHAPRRQVRCGVVVIAAPGASRCHRQVLASNEAAIGKDDRALDRISQLAHVPRPLVRQEMFSRVARNASGRSPDGLADLGKERIR